MKKTIALILAIVMMAALAVPAFAAGVETAAPKTTDTPYTANATVKYGISKTYTVTLPTTIDFGTDLAITAPVSASQVKIAGNEKLTVALVSDFAMTCENCDPVSYAVKVTDVGVAVGSEAAIASGDIVLEVAASKTVEPATGAKQLNFSTAGTSQAGQYSDTITFSIAIATVTPAAPEQGN